MVGRQGSRTCISSFFFFLFLCQDPDDLVWELRVCVTSCFIVSPQLVTLIPLHWQGIIFYSPDQDVGQGAIDQETVFTGFTSDQTTTSTVFFFIRLFDDVFSIRCGVTSLSYCSPFNPFLVPSWMLFHMVLDFLDTLCRFARTDSGRDVRNRVYRQPSSCRTVLSASSCQTHHPHPHPPHVPRLKW